MSSPDGPIVVFDGVCNLCSRWVGFVFAHDRPGRFRFAAMQSEAGRRLLARHGLDPENPVSLLLVEGGAAYTDSEAIIRVLSAFGGRWRLAEGLRLIPLFVRNPLYRLVARNRYRWFGRRDACVVPSPDVAGRFLV